MSTRGGQFPIPALCGAGLILLLAAGLGARQAPQAPPLTPEQQEARRRFEAQMRQNAVLAGEDHQKLLAMLGIRSLRPGADPNHPDAPNAVNYDEAKATPYPALPDPLTMRDGRRVRTAKMWASRRAEILQDFDRTVYGRVPANVPPVTWRVTATRDDIVGGAKVVTREVVGHVDNSADPDVSVDIELTVTLPADAKGPVPVVMELTWAFPAWFPRPPAPSGPTWQEQVLAKGWGYALYVPTSVQADTGAGLTKGIIGLVNRGQPRKPDDWGALRAWAWGASRALDYLETDAGVDATRVAIEGMSRYGKAAVVAMAYDQRFAAGFIASSGKGGLALFRRDYGERLENLAGSGEYHWMAGNFVKYAGPLTPNDLPVDAHELVALCAPRPVFISAGAFEGDAWVDAKGMFLAGVGAGPVYRLLGRKDLGTAELPPVETALVSGEIAFRQHPGGHTAGPNWPTFLGWLDRYF